MNKDTGTADAGVGDLRATFWEPRRVARMAVLIALSAVGAFIKIPSPTGTVALDSAPGFFAGVTFGPVEGAIVGAVGHLFSALTTGFPLGLPMHLIIAVEQAVWVAVFWWVSRHVNLVVAVIVATLLNGVVGALLTIPVFGPGLFASLIVPLTIGAAINIVIAAAAYRAVRNSGLVRRGSA